MYVYEAHAREGKLRIETVASDDGITVPLQRFLDAIDEETLLVPFSHVLFKSGFLQNAKAITERAHEVGAMVVLDTYQSAGTVPFSVKDLNVDFATGGSVKWLCGGPGAGYLYVRPDLQQQPDRRLPAGWPMKNPSRSRQSTVTRQTSGDFFMAHLQFPRFTLRNRGIE